MPKIHVHVDPKGKISMEGEGFSGPACEQALGKLLDGFGRNHGDVEVERKPEYEELRVEDRIG